MCAIPKAMRPCLLICTPSNRWHCSGEAVPQSSSILARESSTDSINSIFRVFIRQKLHVFTSSHTDYHFFANYLCVCWTLPLLHKNLLFLPLLLVVSTSSISSIIFQQCNSEKLILHSRYNN